MAAGPQTSTLRGYYNCFSTSPPRVVPFRPSFAGHQEAARWFSRHQRQMGAVWSGRAEVEPARRAQLITAAAVQTGSSNVTFVVRHIMIIERQPLRNKDAHLV